MEDVKNTTLNSLDTNEVTAPQPEPHNAETLLKAAKSAIKGLNAAEARSRKAMAEMVASFVEMGYAYLTDQKVLTDIDALCVKHGIQPVDLEKKAEEGKPAPNVFLPMMSIVDGKWDDVFDTKTGKPVVDKKTGKTKQKWARNRSFEKYASVIRFFIHNEISHLEVVDILMGDNLIMVEDLEEGVRPRIADIVKADTEQQNGKRRKPQVWTAEAKAAVKLFKPIAVLPLPAGVADKITLSEGYTAIIAEVVDGEIRFVFDSGLKGDALFRVIKNRATELTEALKAGIKSQSETKAAA